MKQKHLFFILMLMPLWGFSQFWVQNGENIYGNADQHFLGEAVASNADGTIIAGAAVYVDAANSNPTPEAKTGYVKVLQQIDDDWVQLGNDIVGELANGQFGISISMNDQGNIIAIGSGNSARQVRVFQYNGVDWVQIGQTLGNSNYARFGFSVSMNGPGNILAVGVYGDNLTRIFKYHEGSMTWEQIGEDIIHEVQFAQSGYSVDLNNDGNIAVISALNKGMVRVYQNIEDSWIQMGQDLSRETNEKFGHKVKINSAGNVIAASSIDANSYDGYVKIFEYTDGLWVQKGETMYGDEGKKFRFGYTIDLDATGDIIVCGTPIFGYQYPISGLGAVRTYKYEDGDWISLGPYINGEEADERFGNSVAVNAEGTKIVTGSLTGNMSFKGRIRTYELKEGSISISTENGLEEVLVGETVQLSASVFPEYIDQEVIWSITSGEENGSINEEGLLTGVYGGLVTVRATSVQYDYIYGEIIVTVVQPVESISVNTENNAEPKVFVSEALQLEAVVLPENATNQAVIWSIADGSDYASVDENGLVTGIAPGVATVRAVSAENELIYGEIEITVLNAVASITVSTVNNEESEVFVSETIQLEAVVLPEDANQEVIWSITDGSDYASVDENGLVTGIAPGVATVRAVSAENELIYGEIEITVLNAVASITVSTVNNEESEVFVSETIQLEAVVLPEDANQEVIWSITDGSDYASVDENGLVTGLTPGIATVRAVSEENELIYGEIEITVEETMSVSDAGLSSFIYYPNPAKDILYIDSKKQDILSVKIFDMSGKLLYEKKTNRLSSVQIPVRHFQSADYVVVLETVESIKTFKFIKR